ncbi:MAG: 3-hydroxy-5-phosphonooxypentane-2,4-dione thiolase [Anaerolineae bacterium]|nr:3-hydroxy-5-phosphonooxypentane-2,4-dione thiolase [Anaerolineae bacterium]
MVGKTRRLNRLFVGEQKRCLMSPLDHGGWLGPVKGIDNPQQIVAAVIKGGANALLISPGFYKAVAPIVPPSTAIVLRLSLTAGLSQQGTQETPIASLETALRMDADAIAVSVFFGREGDIDIYRWLASLVDASQRYNMPVVAEMMPPGDRFFDGEAVAHAARIGMEIGADVIKTNYSGDIESFKQVVTAAPVPIIIAGGPKSDDSATVQMVRDAVSAGAAGVAIGRRVWQADDPQAVTAQIHSALFAVD